VSLEEVKKGLSTLRQGVIEVSDALNRHFAGDLEDTETEDGYAAKMFGFVGRAKNTLPALADRATLAETAFSEILVRYDEDPKTSFQDFFSYLNQFVSSWKVCMHFRIQAGNFAN
jgi:cytokinesis protein